MTHILNPPLFAQVVEDFSSLGDIDDDIPF